MMRFSVKLLVFFGASGCRGKSLEVVNSVGNQENLNENLLSLYQLQEGTVDTGKFVFPGNCFFLLFHHCSAAVEE